MLSKLSIRLRVWYLLYLNSSFYNFRVFFHSTIPHLCALYLNYLNNFKILYSTTLTLFWFVYFLLSEINMYQTDKITYYNRSVTSEETQSSTDMEEIESLHVIYDADGTRTGELMYILKKVLGIAHCAACDITHGPRQEKPEFTRMKVTAWSVPLYNIHRNEMDDKMKNAVQGVFPCVVARTVHQGDIIVMKPDQLDECSGNVAAFHKAVNQSIIDIGLTVPEPNRNSLQVCPLPISFQRNQQEELSDDDNDDAVVPR